MFNDTFSLGNIITIITLCISVAVMWGKDRQTLKTILETMISLRQQIIDNKVEIDRINKYGSTAAQFRFESLKDGLERLEKVVDRLDMIRDTYEKNLNKP